MSVIRVNEFRASPGRDEELKTALGESVRTIRAASGCLSVKLLISERDPRRMAIVEHWDSRESHQAAVAGIPPDAFRKVMALLEDLPAGDYYIEQH